MKRISLFAVLLALAPALLTAQEPAPVTEAAPEQQAPADEPAAETPSYECADAQLEARLAELKQKAEAGDLDAAKQIYARYALAGHSEQGKAWCDRHRQMLEARAGEGDAALMYELALAYLRGQDYTVQDLGKGVTWLHRAMEAGHAEAAHLLGEVLAHQGDKDGSAEAFRKAYEGFAQKAADGDAAALCRQGVMQLMGQGVERQPQEAIAKLDQAAGMGYVPAMEQLFRVYAKGIGVPADMSRGFHYAKMAADTGDAPLMDYAVAFMYFQGQGTAVDEATGDKYLDKAAAANIPSAIVVKAFRLKLAGKEEEAFPYLNQGASMGLVPCLHGAGLCLLYGRAGQEQDESRGIAMLERASDLWNTCQSEVEFSSSAAAAYELARYYEDKDEPKLAETWYSIASSHGYPAAFAKRGWMHLDPFSQETWDPTMAYRWWCTGKERGDETCALYVNLFRYAFIPLVVICVFGLPLILVQRANRKRRREEAAARVKGADE